ncbi:MAG: TonB-dependent receptor [Pseudomonadota bacterium]
MDIRSTPAALCIALVASAFASTDASKAQEIALEGIVVTGENVERTVRETASSVVVFRDEDIQARVEDDSVLKLIQGVPNVTVPTDGGFAGPPTIRGQSSEGPNSGAIAFFSGTVPRTAFVVDGRTLSFNELVFGNTPLWDVKSVEVFRGPQTISQGANSIAGAIIVDTNDPTFERELRFRVVGGSRKRRGAAMVASGPVTDELATRIAFDYSARDTFINYTNAAFLTPDDLDLETFNARGKLLWRPSNLDGLEAKLTVFRYFNSRPTFEAASPPFDELNNITLSNPIYRNTTAGIITDVSYDFGNTVKLFNQLQYSDAETERLTEPDNNGSATIDTNNASNETRLTFGNRAVNGLSGLAGVYYAYTEVDESLLLGYPRGTFLSTFDDQKKNLGLFSELSYRFLDRWVLSGSLRYQRDEITRTGNANFGRGDIPLDFKEAFDAWLPKVSLAYDINKGVTVGGLVSRGYNPGGISLNLITSEYLPFDEEVVWNYELFTRSRLLNNRLRVNANVFYSEYTDAQRFVEVGQVGSFFQSFTVNVDKARSYGLEIGAEADVTDKLRLRAGLGLLKTEITEISGDISGLSEGNEFARAPNVSFSFGFDWDVINKVTWSADVRGSDDYFSADNNADATAIDGYAVVDTRVAYKPSKNVTAFAYVNNVFDDRSVTFKRENRALGGFIEGTPLEPREIGAGVNIKF